jgi:transposase InsO family protein
MYTKEERQRAIELFIKYGKSATSTIRELGYPSRGMMLRWYKDYLEEQETGIEKALGKRREKYTKEQKEKAIEHYVDHGKNFSRTIRALGYPSRPLLREWCAEFLPNSRKIRASSVQYSKEQKKEIVIDFCTREDSGEVIAANHKVSRMSLYNWKNSLLDRETNYMNKYNNTNLSSNKEDLLDELEGLKKQVRALNLEKDILEGTIKLLKKDPGVNPKALTNREKTVLVDTLASIYPVKELLKSLGLVKSNYYYHKSMLKVPEKYEEIRKLIKVLFEKNKKRYGYRRIHSELRKIEVIISEKIVRRIMKEEKLVAVGKRKKKFNAYQGEGNPCADNLLERDFQADAPNQKWLTDITEFAIPGGKVYLSPIVDCFDGFITSWTIGESPNAELVNTMLDNAIDTLDSDEKPIVHSDRGAHYRWPGWLERMERANLKRSMSKKGYTPDNAACEGFFGRLKNEFFYSTSWVGVSTEQFITLLSEYIVWYNEKRIKISLGAVSPLEYRRILGLTA